METINGLTKPRLFTCVGKPQHRNSAWPQSVPALAASSVYTKSSCHHLLHFLFSLPQRESTQGPVLQSPLPLLPDSPIPSPIFSKSLVRFDQILGVSSGFMRVSFFAFSVTHQMTCEASGLLLGLLLT